MKKLPNTVTNMLRLEDTLVVKRGVIEITPDLVNFLAAAKELEAHIKASYSYLEAQMLEHDIKSIKGDWGSLALAERTNYTANDELAPRFYKKVPDTAKIKAYDAAMNRLPAGVQASTSQYLTKRLKV